MFCINVTFGNILKNIKNLIKLFVYGKSDTVSRIIVIVFHYIVSFTLIIFNCWFQCHKTLWILSYFYVCCSQLTQSLNNLLICCVNFKERETNKFCRVLLSPRYTKSPGIIEKITKIVWQSHVKQKTNTYVHFPINN